MADLKRMITIQRVNAAKDGYDIYYPKTVASQVYYDEANNLTVADHITDTAQIHLTATERTALTGYNNANGFLKLDSNGYVPAANLNPSVLAITTEFANIAAMTAAAATVPEGQIVMVTDASADSTVTGQWAIYRKKVDTDPASLDYTIVNDYTDNTDPENPVVHTAGWQKIAEKESLDVTVTWDSITGKPSSTPAAIDQAVTDDHTHSNKAVIDEFTDTGTDQAPVLNYKGNALTFAADNTTFTLVAYGDSVPQASTLKAGDFVFVETVAAS